MVRGKYPRESHTKSADVEVFGSSAFGHTINVQLVVLADVAEQPWMSTMYFYLDQLKSGVPHAIALRLKQTQVSGVNCCMGVRSTGRCRNQCTWLTRTPHQDYVTNMQFVSTKVFQNGAYPWPLPTLHERSHEDRLARTDSGPRAEFIIRNDGREATNEWGEVPGAIQSGVWSSR